MDKDRDKGGATTDKPVPHDPQDQQADADTDIPDPWEGDTAAAARGERGDDVRDAGEAGTGRPDDVPDTDEAGTGRRGESRQTSAAHPAPQESSG
ncbi:hypothetical protein HUT18_32215 [Streptomyces sp. NA04227]|uniref:hypothetical protein n=1 Tax=Streptomyces sp. NA04227 TaxID=2742136 RepID=UPI00159066D7|nr:hypothetical protein [Streptomyces sp. NA04227]QKW10386.1 hypothetical protein HUT18_32215 [Streptomyces sp. NA04227]